jgi:colicin import membrane protein
LFGLGGTELAIILLFGFLIFGPDKLPEIARTAGRVIRQFRTAQEQMNKVIKEEVYDPIKDLEPLVNPFAGILDEDKSTTEKTQAAKKPSSKTSSSDGNAKAIDAADKSESVGSDQQTVQNSSMQASSQAIAGSVTSSTSSSGSQVASAGPAEPAEPTEPTGSARLAQSAEPAEPEAQRPKPEELKAALAAEAQQKRRKVVAASEPAAASDNAGSKESFAERRSRLEQEHNARLTEKRSSNPQTEQTDREL